jgi:hypothetical protein
MIRRVLVTLSLVATLGLAIGACNTNPGSSPTLDSPGTMPSEAPSMAPVDSPMPSAS